MKTRITLIIFCALIASCSTRDEASMPELSVGQLKSPLPISTDMSLLATITASPTTVTAMQAGIESPTAIPTAQYAILSPLAIKKGNIVIEVTSYSISSSTFRFGVQITGLSPSQIPELSPEYTFYPVREVKFFHGDQGTPLELEPFGGGGGGGTNDDGTMTINQDFSYKLVSPFPVGQKQHIIAVITLHEIFGIAEPIRFDLEVVPKEGVQG